jgi:hypothetical protein
MSSVKGLERPRKEIREDWLYWDAMLIEMISAILELHEEV